MANRTNKSCLILKGNFEKEYDLINWSFQDYMLIRFGLRMEILDESLCVFRKSCGVG